MPLGFPYLQYIDYVSNQDRSHYNALQVSLTQRTSHGLSFTAAYTYSHGLDDASQNFQGTVPLNNADYDLNYGNSDYDIRHRLTFELTYALPGIEDARTDPARMGDQFHRDHTAWDSLVRAGHSNDFSGTNEVNNPNAWGEAWNFSGNPNDFKATPTGIPFFSGPRRRLELLILAKSATHCGASRR